jgi:DNA polymerase-4
MGAQRTVFHIDVNSAFLSWEAVYRLQHGESLDLRTIPAVVGGNEKNRHGIVLAKSIPAKKYHIQTGESLYAARIKCPGLVIVPPRYGIYINCSNAMLDILREYSPEVQRFSVDECFLEFTSMEKIFGDPVTAANIIKNRIKRELGFTVNIGISVNKLLAKMAGELSKPDKVHTLYPDEIPKKMWPLPVEDLLMVGRATAPKLHTLGIKTIGDLAKYSVKNLELKLKSHGLLIWQYANGLESSEVRNISTDIKGIGNATTTKYDVEDQRTAEIFLLSLTETVAGRLRKAGYCCSLVAIGIKDANFRYCSHQKKLYTPVNSTQQIFSAAKLLFKELWRGQPLRLLGVRVSDLSADKNMQLSIFHNAEQEQKMRALDGAVDNIRLQFGSRAIIRAAFLHSGINPLSGGVGEEEYPIMSSIL